MSLWGVLFRRSLPGHSPGVTSRGRAGDALPARWRWAPRVRPVPRRHCSDQQSAAGGTPKCPCALAAWLRQSVCLPHAKVGGCSPGGAQAGVHQGGSGPVPPQGLGPTAQSCSGGGVRPAGGLLGDVGLCALWAAPSGDTQLALPSVNLQRLGAAGAGNSP